jgi:hypothetical protein
MTINVSEDAAATIFRAESLLLLRWEPLLSNVGTHLPNCTMSYRGIYEVGRLVRQFQARKLSRILAMLTRLGVQENNLVTQVVSFLTHYRLEPWNFDFLIIYFK